MSELKWLKSWPIMLILKVQDMPLQTHNSIHYVKHFKFCTIVANMKLLPEPKLYQKPMDDHRNYMPVAKVQPNCLPPISIVL